MVVREPMNYSLEITKSLVPKHLKSLGYSELKRSYFMESRKKYTCLTHYETDPLGNILRGAGES